MTNSNEILELASDVLFNLALALAHASAIALSLALASPAAHVHRWWTAHK